jgi:hypothetical protein
MALHARIEHEDGLVAHSAYSTEVERPFHGKPNSDSTQAEQHRSEATRLSL